MTNLFRTVQSIFGFKQNTIKFKSIERENSCFKKQHGAVHWFDENFIYAWDNYQFSNRFYPFSFHFDGSADHSGQIGLRANIAQTKNLQTNTIIL